MRAKNNEKIQHVGHFFERALEKKIAILRGSVEKSK